MVDFVEHGAPRWCGSLRWFSGGSNPMVDFVEHGAPGGVFTLHLGRSNPMVDFVEHGAPRLVFEADGDWALFA
jgi:hypothetical protein